MANTAGTGRRPLETICPHLGQFTCVLSVGLRKDWAKKASYWIDVYAKPLGPHKKSHLLRMARQWSFYRQTTKEQIQDQYVMPNEWTSVNNAVDSLINYVAVRLAEKGEVVHEILNADGWDDAALELKLKLLEDPRRGASDAGPANSHSGSLPPKKKTIAEKFKESVAERAKRAKW